MAGGQKLEAQMPEIQGTNTQGVADPGENRRGLRRFPDELDIGLSRDQRIERVEQDADRRRQPHALAHFAGPFQQKRARRLQLIRKRRLLPDRRAISRREILVGVEDAGHRTQIDRELADRFARDHPAGARVGENGRQKRNEDIRDAPSEEQELRVNRGRNKLRAGIPE